MKVLKASSAEIKKALIQKGAPVILGINPPIEDFRVQGGLIFPLGLLIILSILKEGGATVEFIDCLYSEDKAALKYQNKKKVVYNMYGSCQTLTQTLPKPDILNMVPLQWKLHGMNYELLEHILKTEYKPDAVLITSGLTYHYKGVQKTISLVKKVYGSIPVILGGIYVTLCYEHALKYSGADYVIKGPGEKQIQDLLIDKLNFKIKRIAVDNINQVPEPDISFYFQRGDTMHYAPLMLNRGCPMQCTYCASRLLSPFSQKSPEIVFKTICNYISKGVRNFLFYDDALLIKAQSRLDVILQKIKNLRIRATFTTPNSIHARYMTKRRAQLMKDTGFRFLKLSLETTNLKRMKESNKISIKEFLTACDYFKDAGFNSKHLSVYYMVGQPGQDIEDMVDTMIIIYKQGIPAIPLLYSPIPGTVDYINAVKNGIIPENMDPLLTNRECFLFSQDDYTRQQVKRVVRLAHVLKDTLDYSCNLLNNDAVTNRFRQTLLTE